MAKRIKHNDLTHYFLRPHEQLPRAYLDSCEKFFKELSAKQQAKKWKLNKFTMNEDVYIEDKQQAPSAKQELTSSKLSDSSRIIKENKK